MKCGYGEMMGSFCSVTSELAPHQIQKHILIINKSRIAKRRAFVAFFFKKWKERKNGHRIEYFRRTFACTSILNVTNQHSIIERHVGVKSIPAIVSRQTHSTVKDTHLNNMGHFFLSRPWILFSDGQAIRQSSLTSYRELYIILLMLIIPFHLRPSIPLSFLVVACFTLSNL